MPLEIVRNDITKMKAYALTYGSILKIAIYVLERLRISPIIRYKQFELAFDNRVKEEIKHGK